MSNAWEALCAYAETTARWRNTAALLQWDQETGMPYPAAGLRAEQSADLTRLLHQRQHDGTWEDLLKAAKNESEKLSDREQKALAFWEKEQEKTKRIPESHVIALSRLQSRAFLAWNNAREGKNKEAYLDCLSELVELKKETCALLGFADNPYDGLLDQYDPGLSSELVDGVFAHLSKELPKRILALEKNMPETPFPIALSKEEQIELGHELLEWIGFDLSRGRLDKAPHPFCLSMSPNDVRLTYQINEKNPGVFIWAILHEGGHGLYEQGLHAEPAGTPLTTAVSLTIHESQSRFWENHMGRNLEFWQVVCLEKGWPPNYAEHIWKHANKVSRSQIRIYADELSYHLHILLRYRIEKGLIEGSLQAKDVETAWNDMALDFFGQVPAQPAEGFVQDIHWAHGSMGYFPTYTMGSLLAAHFSTQIFQEADAMPKLIQKAKAHFEEKVFCHGALLRSEELLPNNPKEIVDCFLHYIDSKYQAYL